MSLKKKKKRCVTLLKISTDLCCTVFYVETKDAENHKSRHLFFKFYMKLVVKLFFCGHVKERTKVQNFLTCCLVKEEPHCITAPYMLGYCKLMSNLDESLYEIKKWHSLCTTCKQ